MSLLLSNMGFPPADNVRDTNVLPGAKAARRCNGRSRFGHSLSGHFSNRISNDHSRSGTSATSSALKSIREKRMQERDEKEDERGKRASFDRASGEVHGAGSGAGGGGNLREDYDSDPMSGAGEEPQGGPRPIDEAARNPEDKHQGDSA
jgi:hypothetical protein